MLRRKGEEHTLQPTALVRDKQMIALDDTLNGLAEFDPRKAKVVELRFFGGLSVAENAQVLKAISTMILRIMRSLLR